MRDIREIEINEIKCERALVPTGIKIAPYVINPYRGCGFGCIYCYSQKNKCFQKRKQKWGEFVDVKKNCLEVLERELKNIKPEKVLLGSTTEVYQQIEKEYLLTRDIIELLNKHNIPFTILTKSNLIIRDADILHKAKICFTINFHADNLIRMFEPVSPGIGERIETIKKLKEKGVRFYIHVGPVIPNFTDAEKIMEMVYGLTERVDFESFSYWMSPQDILSEKDIFSSEEAYNNYWDNLRNEIIRLNAEYNYKLNFHFHPYKVYWQSQSPRLVGDGVVPF